MRYVTKKKEPPPQPTPREDKQLKVLERIEKIVKGGLAVKDNVDSTNLSNLLLTTIKQNEELSKIHATQITRAISDIRQLNAKAPVVTVQTPQKRTFHMDVNRGGDGYIKSVDGTIEG